MSEMYGRLAPWWPLISPVDAYVDEAAQIAELLRAGGSTRTVLDLGAGGGHLASWLRYEFELTLVDRSPEMLAVSMAINPACAHVVGDMRVVRLAARFDAVLVHDAADYLLTEADLDATIATAVAHCRPGGLVVFAPNAVAETFQPSSGHGGVDEASGRGARFVAWTWDPDPDDTEVSTAYAFLLRRADGAVESCHEVHQTGLFPRATWEALLRARGLTVVVHAHQVDGVVRAVFVGRAP